MALPYPEEFKGLSKGQFRRKIYEIKPENWNKTFPYSFRVVRIRSNSTASVSVVDNSVKGFKEFILPINPQNLSISAAFSIRASATNRGIVEEHNGLIFRTIVIQGTFGVAPRSRAHGQLRGNLRSPTPSAFTSAVRTAAVRTAASITPNAAGGAAAVRSNISNVLAAAGNLPDIVSGVDFNDEVVLENLGHSKINQFVNYLTAYAELKKLPDQEDVRLIFINRKDNALYVVTPQTIDTTKNANDPHVTTYRLVMRAWDLATDSGIDAVEPLKISQEPRLLSRIFGVLRNSRAVLSAASATLRGVVQDFDTNFELMNEVLYLVKDAVGVRKTAADMPEIIQDKWTEMSERFDKIKDDIKTQATSGSGASDANVLSSLKELQETISSSGKFSVTNPSGLPVGTLSDVQNATNQQQRDKFNPIKSVRGRIEHADLLDKLPISALTLSSADRQVINSKTNRIRRFTIADFDRIRSAIDLMRSAFEDSLGVGDATVDAALGRTSGTQQREATTEDFKIIKAMNDIIESIDGLSSKNEVTTKRRVDPFVRAQINANNPELSIRRFTNGFPVPFPSGGTLEKLAYEHLGSPDRWLEIVIANGLKPPYIDEVGFTRSFTSSGTVNSFTIDDDTNVFVNQEVVLSSSSQLPSVRRIVSIRELTPTSFLVTVDGDADLDNFTTAQSAQMKAFLPSTVNSDKIIQIPTKDPEPDSNAAIPRTRDIPATINLNRQQKAMGVDIRLTDSFDLALTNTGDFKLATALENAVQAVKLKIALEKGALNRHPEVGLGLKIGEREARSVSEIRTLLENAILGDRRFSDVPEINIAFDGPVATINLRVEVADGGDVVPLSFTLNTE
jgi:hypothetical protein